MLELEFSTNNDFEPVEESSVDLGIQVSSRHSPIIENSALVQLHIQIGEKNEKYPFFLNTIYQAEFCWDSDAVDGEMAEKLLSKNAVLLLMSYARPAISTITNFSKFASFDIPFMDLTN